MASRSRLSLLWISVVLMLALVLAACGGGAVDEDPEPGEAPETTVDDVAEEVAEEAPVAAEEEPVEVAAGACPASANGLSIEMWSPLTGPDGDEMTALAERFSSENESGITVLHVPQPEYIQKLNAGAAANQLPAMTVVRAINVGELAERNVLKPISEEALAVLGDNIAGEFPENVWSAGEYDGARYSIPLDVHPLVMYYNKNLFEEAGVELPGNEPMSPEQFQQTLEQLDAAGVQPIAIGNAFQGATLFQTMIRQYGGALTNEEGTEVTYNSEAGARALEFVNELRSQYSPDISGAGDPEVAAFKQGNAAIVMHGPWHISDLQRLDFVGFAPVPQMGDEYAVWGGSHQLALTTDDPAQQAAAACWIDWLSENSVEWAAAGQIPARTSAREDPRLAEIAPAISGIAASADDAIILPQVAELEGALWGEFGPVVDGVLLGEESDIPGALEAAAGRSQQIIDENQARYEGS